MFVSSEQFDNMKKTSLIEETHKNTTLELVIPLIYFITGLSMFVYCVMRLIRARKYRRILKVANS